MFLEPGALSHEPLTGNHRLISELPWTSPSIYIEELIKQQLIVNCILITTSYLLEYPLIRRQKLRSTQTVPSMRGSDANLQGVLRGHYWLCNLGKVFLISRAKMTIATSQCEVSRAKMTIASSQCEVRGCVDISKFCK